MGQLVSDGTRDYVWVTDETNGDDVIQNLNLAVSDPASQPYVTAVGGRRSVTGPGRSGPPPTEKAWNDPLYYSEGAGGGGISQTFTMPAYQQALGTVSGSSGTPCASGRGLPRGPRRVGRRRPEQRLHHLRHRQRPDGWVTLDRSGGTSGAAPLWAAVLAVVASADGNTSGLRRLNPASTSWLSRPPALI